MACYKIGIASVLLAVAAFSPAARAQQEKITELAGVVGSTFIGNQTIPSPINPQSIIYGRGRTFEINLARHLITRDNYQLSLELPVVANVDEDLYYPTNSIPQDYSSYFITPSARVTFYPHFLYSPWASVGGGAALFRANNSLRFGGPNPGAYGTAAGVFQVGGGLDINPWRAISVRVEVRLFNSGQPTLNINPSSRQNNVFAGGGVVWHF
jgi:opacity protein-like surface antigen